MKLLIITQKVDINDSILGFFHRWIEEFAKNCEKVTVICLKKGEYNLPNNVKVLSLGKELNKNNNLKIFLKIKYIFRFYKYIWQERKNYDSVFVHMNQIYVILGGFIWKLLNKKIGLWYAHGGISTSLKIAEKITNTIFTSTKSGFRLKSNKIKIVGQGIDVDFFKPLKNKEKNETFQIITVGRISPIKDYETLISAAEILKRNGFKFKINIVGGPGTKEQGGYLQRLEDVVKEKKLNTEIIFLGSKSNKDILEHLQKSDLFVNMSHTGSLDKAILEAMACGLPILTCNEALNGVLGGYKSILMYEKSDFKGLAKKVMYFINLSKNQRNNISVDLKNIIDVSYGLSGFIKNIIKLI